LDALFPSAINGDGVIERSTNDIWVYNGTTWNNVGPTPGPTVVTATVIPPWNEISIFDATVRTRLLVESLAYGLTLLTQPDAYGVKLGMTALNVTVLLEVPATTAIAIAALPPSKAISVPSQNISLAAATPLYAIGIPVPSVSIDIEGLELQYAGLERTVVVVPGVDTSVQAHAPSVVLDIYMEIPLTTISLAAPTILIPETVLTGTAAPVLGRTGAVTFTDWTRIVNADTDDASVAFSGFGFTFTLNGTGYTECFVGSNGYITFGSGSSEYQSLSASVPALNKLHFAGGDRSFQRVYTRTGRVRAGYKYASVRWEGSSGTSGTLGSPTVVTEITFYEQNLAGNQWIDVRYGVNATTGLYMLANSSTAYASGTSSADSSWVFEGNAAGTSWTLTSNRYIG